MKNNIALLLFLFYCSQSTAQKQVSRYTPPSLYSYDTCQYLQQVAGEWMYINSNDTIKFTFRIHTDSSEDQHSILTQLYGWQEYKHGGTIVESDYQNRFDALPYFVDTVVNKNYSITLIGTTYCNSSLYSLGGTIIDFLQSREMHMVKAVINRSNGITTMLWKQRHREGYGAFTGARGMTLPREFILIKQ